MQSEQLGKWPFGPVLDEDAELYSSIGVNLHNLFPWPLGNRRPVVALDRDPSGLLSPPEPRPRSASSRIFRGRPIRLERGMRSGMPSAPRRRQRGAISDSLAPRSPHQSRARRAPNAALSRPPNTRQHQPRHDRTHGTVGRSLAQDPRRRVANTTVPTAPGFVEALARVSAGWAAWVCDHVAYDLGGRLVGGGAAVHCAGVAGRWVLAVAPLTPVHAVRTGQTVVLTREGHIAVDKLCRPSAYGSGAGCA